MFAVLLPSKDVRKIHTVLVPCCSSEHKAEVLTLRVPSHSKGFGYASLATPPPPGLFHRPHAAQGVHDHITCHLQQTHFMQR